MHLYTRGRGKHQTIINFTRGNIDPRYCRKRMSLDFGVLRVATLTIKDRLNRI
jgi:hypothetical protein